MIVFCLKKNLFVLFLISINRDPYHVIFFKCSRNISQGSHISNCKLMKRILYKILQLQFIPYLNAFLKIAHETLDNLYISVSFTYLLQISHKDFFNFLKQITYTYAFTK